MSSQSPIQLWSSRFIDWELTINVCKVLGNGIFYTAKALLGVWRKIASTRIPIRMPELNPKIWPTRNTLRTKAPVDFWGAGCSYRVDSTSTSSSRWESCATRWYLKTSAAVQSSACCWECNSWRMRSSWGRGDESSRYSRG